LKEAPTVSLGANHFSTGNITTDFGATPFKRIASATFDTEASNATITVAPPLDGGRPIGTRTTAVASPHDTGI